MDDPSCLFCKIAAKQIPAAIIHEDEHCVAFKDIRPVAPTHFLVIPRTHFARLDVATQEHRDVLGHLLLVAGKLAKDLGAVEDGYRTVINAGPNAGQTVFHVHVHVLAGRDFSWPPG